MQIDDSSIRPKRLRQSEGNGLSSVARLSSRAKMPGPHSPGIWRTWLARSDRMDANYEPAHYHSEYGCGRLIAVKIHVGDIAKAKRPLATPEAKR